MSKDKVVFRKFPDGDIIALFPDEIFSDGFITSYMRIGQHSGAMKSLIDELKPATDQESLNLKNELIQIGYNI